MDQTDINRKIASIYYNDEEGSFASINRLYKAVNKKFGNAISLDEVKKFLEDQEIYELFYQDQPQKGPARYFITSNPGQLVCFKKNVLKHISFIISCM